jgi:hypothetical protein
VKVESAAAVLILIFTIIIAGIILVGCVSIVDGNGMPVLEATVFVQSTEVVYLKTQVSKLANINQSQDEIISYLSTQMPYALGLITQIPPGITITPTPFSSYEEGALITPTLTPYIDIEYPPDTRTGIEDVDIVIEAIQNGGIDERIDLVRLISTACTTADGLGGPPKCREGEKDGDIVEAFPVSNGEGHHIRPDDFRRVFDFSVRGLMAVYRVPDDAYERDYWPAGAYGIVFTSEDGGHPHTIIAIVEGGKIVRLNFNPTWPPFDFVWEQSDEFLLTPIR